MDTEQYIAQKRALQVSKEAEERTHRTTCYSCWKKISQCLCSSIIPFSTRTEIVLLMHPKEARKQKLGTGRMTLATLKNSRMYCAVNFDEHSEFQSLLKDPLRHVVLVYPSLDAQSLDGNLPKEWNQKMIKEDKILTLLLIDATWPCAKKMMKLSSSLHDLPMASFQKEYAGKFIIKHQPDNLCLSTLETVVHALNGLKSMGLEKTNSPIERLWDPFNEMLQFQVKCAEDPSIPSNRGRKSRPEDRPENTRVREKKNRLFYWDLEKSQIGDSHKKGK
jgi:DTW domain-containing protein YfiP